MSVSRRRDAILKEMGLAPLWRLREGGSVEAELAPAPAPAPVLTPLVPVSPSFAPRLPLLGDQRNDILPAGGVVTSATRSDGDDAVAGLDWEALEARIRGCEACGLCKRRKQAVPGVGDQQADWLFVGEGPGAEEDERGEPFVGQAGRLLDAMLASIDLKRGEDVYIANAVKCRPPNNRTPEATELAACFPYLERQIALIQPRLIIALGRPAAQALLNEEVRIATARGRLYTHGGIPVVVTYHPAYLLRNLQDKSKAWEDLCFARRTMKSLKPA